MHVFQQDDYYNQPAFSGFLPGVAGLDGIPIWVFYVNRGQGVVSFGTESKDGCIAEFFSAAAAYRAVSEQGFRTFIKVSGPEPRVYEPFARQVTGDNTRLSVTSDKISFTETNPDLGLRVDVSYRILPNASVGALIREAVVTNISDKPLSYEIIDGLAVIIPAGVDYGGLKEIPTTAQAWMTARRVGRNSAVYRVGATMSDSANVEEISRVNFAVGFRRSGTEQEPVDILFDADVLFPPQQQMTRAVGFENFSLKELCGRTQIEEGKLPCAFFADEATLSPGGSTTIVGLYGSADSLEVFQGFQREISAPGRLQQGIEAGDSATSSITRVCETRTANTNFNAYCEQNFLDNVLRGGFPHIEKTPQKDVYIPVFSRKHGDLERDYNWFVIPPENYSQGWGNYRDVNQNRRSDIFFVPQAGMENLWEFVSLIQADGYNPLVVQGRGFLLSEVHELSTELQDYPATRELVSHGEFSPGRLYQSIFREADSRDEALRVFRLVLGRSEAVVHADHGEGFWIDHWTYNNDLLENCLAVFPEQAADLFWAQRRYPYYQSSHHVLPRTQKWSVVNGKVRQYKAVREDEDAAAASKWMLDSAGRMYLAGLGEKLLGLSAVKFLTRDAFGIGIEMEAGKPGWYDALNGLPGLLGSSLPESWELLRLLGNLRNGLTPGHDPVEVSQEIARLLSAIRSCLTLPTDTDAQLHMRWDAMAGERERYREEVRQGFSGNRVRIPRQELITLLSAMADDVRAGLQRGKERNNGVYPTYLIIQPRDAAAVQTYLADGSGGGRLQFDLRIMPLFLEGFVRALSVETNPEARRAIHHMVMHSNLYDRKLGMLRVNDSLEHESQEIGRARAFTPGWLENGSIWMHMEYKYLLALLRGEMYQEFWELARTMLVPFMDPQVYGRSIFENSSFIVSSCHPDSSLHGRGFVARLSGSTAEFISMWVILFFGRVPFRMHDGRLQLVLDPCIPGELFDTSGEVTCSWLHNTSVTYINPSRSSVIPGGAVRPRRITLQPRGQQEDLQFDIGVIPSPYAEMTRRGEIRSIRVELA